MRLYAYHVTFGVGKASHVICKVPLWPSNTLMSLNDCVIFSGARKDGINEVVNIKFSNGIECALIFLIFDII
jgi:hypothetical protein